MILFIFSVVLISFIFQTNMSAQSQIHTKRANDKGDENKGSNKRPCTRQVPSIVVPEDQHALGQEEPLTVDSKFRPSLDTPLLEPNGYEYLYPFRVKDRETRLCIELLRFSRLAGKIASDGKYPELDSCGLREEDLRFLNTVFTVGQFHLSRLDCLQCDTLTLKVFNFLVHHKINLPNIDIIKTLAPLACQSDLSMCNDNIVMLECRNINFLAPAKRVSKVIAQELVSRFWNILRHRTLDYISSMISKLCNAEVEHYFWKYLIAKQLGK